tara:strand:- start:83 stop:451 length:369 start_codon:yes stop_codon:yes gene_type:complete
MALSYNYEKCDDSNWTKDDRNIAGQFAWSLMAVGTQNVTEKNKDEIIFRLMFLQNIGMGVYIKDQTLERYIDVVNKMIGYSTNVGNENRRKWISYKIKYFAREIQNDIDIKKQKQEEERKSA